VAIQVDVACKRYTEFRKKPHGSKSTSQPIASYPTIIPVRKPRSFFELTKWYFGDVPNKTRKGQSFMQDLTHYTLN